MSTHEYLRSLSSQVYSYSETPPNDYDNTTDDHSVMQSLVF